MATAARALPIVIAFAFAACSSAPTPAPSTAPSRTADATPVPVPSSTSIASPLTSPSAAVDPATSLEIAPPYELDPPSDSDFEQLSGNIRGLASDLALAAGSDFSPADFPMGFRFIRDGTRSVGLLVVLGAPAGVAELPGLLEAVAPPVAAEVNARLSYETVDGVQVALLKGPIASALAIVDGYLVMAQSGQPAVQPIDLMTAVIAAN
jgi:hypothetical protein